MKDKISDNDFSYYNVGDDIMKYPNEVFGVSTPFATVNHQGVINLNAFGFEYSDYDLSFFEYQGEVNVDNKHTRNFYEQARATDGATFRMYPGNRMLLGNLIGNNVEFQPVKYHYDKETGKNNLLDIYKGWNYLAKLTADSDEDAKNNYNIRNGVNVDNAISNITSAINFGHTNCEREDIPIEPWLRENYCYDENSLYDEIFHEKFDIDKKDVVTFLEERFEKFDGEHDAIVPTKNTVFVEGQYYISVKVTKQIDYNKYKQYLKSVYIPYYYINCDNCSYKDSSDDVKASRAKYICDNIMSYTNAFKKYNNEELIPDEYSYGGSSEGTIGGVTGNKPSTNSGVQFGSLATFNGNYIDLPKTFYSQLIVPFSNKTNPFLESCSEFYTDSSSSSYYCGTYGSKHNGVDILSGVSESEAVIVAPADGVVASCKFDNYGPWLSIKHELKDDSGQTDIVYSYYRHWLDLNGNRSCETFTEGQKITQGQELALESGQGGTISYGRHLHFGIKASDGTVYNVENYLIEKGVKTGSITSNCAKVRENCYNILGY